jgi:hypothetical protein
MEISMKSNATNYLKVIGLTIGLGVCSTQQSFSSDDKAGLQTEGSVMALRTAFELPMKFSTDVGEFSVTFTNRPDEPDNHYMQPYNLATPEKFLETSHLQFMNRVALYFNEQEAARQQMLEQFQKDKMLPPELQGKYIDMMLYRKSFDDQSDEEGGEPPLKMMKMLMDNSIFPLQFQTYDFHLTDRYAFPDSVMTINWSFEPEDNPSDYTDLSKFQDRKEFYSYMYNGLVGYLTKTASALELKNFRENIQPFMYS